MSREKTNYFARIRSDHRNEMAEDYLEAIADIERQNGQCRGSDLTRYFSVRHATVTQTLARLNKAGLVETEPYGPVRLTRKGRNVAEKSRERHEIVLSFLRALGISKSVAAADTEGIEHHVSDETLLCFKKFVERSKQQRT